MSRPFSSLAELRDVFRQSGTSAEQLARATPVNFAYLVCVLSDRLHRVLTSESLWSTLEKVLAPADTADRLRVDPGRLVFLTITLDVPNFSVIRITVDLSTLDVREELIATLPWPPSRHRRGQCRTSRRRLAVAPAARSPSSPRAWSAI